MKTRDYKRAYVWQLAVRIFHWANALSITLLIITGYLIAHPPAINSAAEASTQFWFGYIREIHFMSAYVMFAVLFLRLYYAIVGNKYANWKVFVPFNKKGFVGVWHTIKHDILLLNDKEYDYKTSVHVGHNNVAAISYLVMFFMAIIMIFTGFGLYSANATWFLPKMFAWVPEFFGGDMNIRWIHHITMWTFILFIAVHVYLVFYHDWLEGHGESSSMISGYKFVRTERLTETNDKTENAVK
jgi:Ni/Fe-hydrogenase 1 B-type cytochrome subunit